MDKNYDVFLDSFRKNVADNVRRHRLHRNWTIKHLADLCETKPESISKVENARVTITGHTLCKIAYSFGLKPEVLIESPDKIDFYGNILNYLNNLSEDDIKQLSCSCERILRRRKID